jgi:hypothetical protein
MLSTYRSDSDRGYLGPSLEFATEDYSLSDAQGYADQSRAS